MGAGQNGEAVGADLVGHVAVGGDAVGSGDHDLDSAFLHELGGHAVAEDGGFYSPAFDITPCSVTIADR